MAINISENELSVYDIQNEKIESRIKIGRVEPPGDRILIEIPAEGNYIEILGHKIDGFESFEMFKKYLEKCAGLEYENQKLKDTWEKLRRYLVNYKKEKCIDDTKSAAYGRYCVALSIDDILAKMKEIEEN